MHIRLITVSDRQPAWVERAFADYARRLPRQWGFRHENLPTAKRSGDAAARAVAAEGERIMRMLKPGERVVLLDEAGQGLASAEFAARLAAWQARGDDLAFVIGGPDGVGDAVRARAGFRWSLSALTLPHGLARVVVAEQLYRAWSLAAGHPYHRG